MSTLPTEGEKSNAAAHRGSTRLCSKCRELLPLDAFGKGAHHYYCLPCRNAYARERRRNTRSRPVRGYRMQIPPDFEARAGREWDTDLALVYGVAVPTIRRWRRARGIPARDRAPYMAGWGKMGMRALRELHPDKVHSIHRPKAALAARARVEAALDRTGITRPLLTSPHLGDDRRLMAMAMQAFGRARSDISEGDHV